MIITVASFKGGLGKTTTPDILALDALALMVDYLSQMQWVNYKILLTVIPSPPRQAGQELVLPSAPGSVSRFESRQNKFIDGEQTES